MIYACPTREYAVDLHILKNAALAEKKNERYW
jgi:hypothetical protein